MGSSDEMGFVNIWPKKEAFEKSNIVQTRMVKENNFEHKNEQQGLVYDFPRIQKCLPLSFSGCPPCYLSRSLSLLFQGLLAHQFGIFK